MGRPRMEWNLGGSGPNFADLEGNQVNLSVLALYRVSYRVSYSHHIFFITEMSNTSCYVMMAFKSVIAFCL